MLTLVNGMFAVVNTISLVVFARVWYRPACDCPRCTRTGSKP